MTMDVMPCSLVQVWQTVIFRKPEQDHLHITLSVRFTLLSLLHQRKLLMFFQSIRIPELPSTGILQLPPL